LPFIGRQRGHFLAAEDLSLLLYFPGDVFGGHLDDFQTVYVAIVGGVPPGKEPVTPQDDPANPRVFLQAFFELQPQVKTRALPGDPAHGVAPDFPGNFFAVFGGGNCNKGVRVQVVDMFERQEPVQGGVD